MEIEAPFGMGLGEMGGLDFEEEDEALFTVPEGADPALHAKTLENARKALKKRQTHTEFFNDLPDDLDDQEYTLQALQQDPSGNS